MIIGTQKKSQKITNEQLYDLYVQTQDEKYLSDILQANLWNIISIVKSELQNIPHSHMEDMMQEGCIGYVEGLRRYKSGIGVKVNSYCNFWVIKYIKDYQQKNLTTVKIPQLKYREGVRVFSTEYNSDWHSGEDTEYEDSEAYIWMDYMIERLVKGKQEAIDSMSSDKKGRRSSFLKNFLIEVMRHAEPFKELPECHYLILDSQQMEFWEHRLIGTSRFAIRAKDVFLYEQKRYNFTVSKLNSGLFKIKI